MKTAKTSAKHQRNISAKSAPQILAPADDPTIVLALTCLTGRLSDAAREQCPPGAYHVDAKIRLFGQLIKANDQSVNATRKPDLATLLAFVLEKFSAKARAAILAEPMHRFETPHSDAIAAAKAWIDQHNEAYVQPRRGAISGELELMAL